ncbi:MAG TPA: tetratricopeptide repeat protein [Abditibacteriaceae bacterium]|nr:tetratricopeptide repeat protein [Abditibacteriaceae bacterium]
MSKIDKLLERMMQRRIEAAVLINDQPARFMVAGHETSGGVLPAAQLYGLVQEITPPDLWWQLTQDSSFEFAYQSPHGTFVVAIVRAGDSFQVSIAPDFTAQAHEAQALCNEGIRLGKLVRYEEAISLFDATTEKYAAAPAPDVQAQVARAYKSRGAVLHLMGAEQAALASFEEVLRRFGDSTHPAVQRQVAKALLNKAATFFHLGQRLKALAIYNELLGRFENHTHPAVGALVDEARRARDALRAAR